MNLSISAFKNIKNKPSSIDDPIILVTASSYSATDLTAGRYYLDFASKDYLYSSTTDPLFTDNFDLFLKSLICLVSGEYPHSDLMKVRGSTLSTTQSYAFQNLTQFNFNPSNTVSVSGFGSKSAKILHQDFLAFSSLAESFKANNVPNFYTIYNFLRKAFGLAAQNGIILFTTY